MSRAWVLLGALALAGLPGLGGLMAQEVQPDPLALVGDSIRALMPRVEEADSVAEEAEKARADSIRAAEEVPQDTVMVGPIRIVTVRGQGELARDVFRLHVGEILPWIRGSEGLFRDHAWAFHYGWLRQPLFLDSERVHDVNLSRRYPPARLQDPIRRSLGEALHDLLPDEEDDLRDLAPAGSFLPTVDWGWVYRDLASAPYLSAKECLAGDLEWCWEALGLTTRYAEETTWNTSEKRRRLVQSRYEQYLWGSLDRMGTRENLVWGCLVMKEDRACDLVLEGYPLRPGYSGRGYSVPLSGAARGTIVGEALRLGGAGSFTRLLERPEASIQDRLAYAAGIPAEELVARWRERVLSSRPNAQAGLMKSPFSLAFWVFLLIAFALRSSRWRLG